MLPWFQAAVRRRCSRRVHFSEGRKSPRELRLGPCVYLKRGACAHGDSNRPCPDSRVPVIRIAYRALPTAAVISVFIRIRDFRVHPHRLPRPPYPPRPQFTFSESRNSRSLRQGWKTKGPRTRKSQSVRTALSPAIAAPLRARLTGAPPRAVLTGAGWAYWRPYLLGRGGTFRRGADGGKRE